MWGRLKKMVQSNLYTKQKQTHRRRKQNYVSKGERKENFQRADRAAPGAWAASHVNRMGRSSQQPWKVSRRPCQTVLTRQGHTP